ncbi:MAG TPA: MaoC/PaaZ C-terminal domain-containing protein [Jiangellaceae bacterium]|jgi:acyl dehydratase|nr:MaoC/PaaZ C-terminal domain-containing protein [Jiangellaceae bacterium]
MADLGEQLPERQYQLSRVDLVRYAGASGDVNPIHWSDRIASAAGLPGVIAHGMLTMGLAGRFVTEWTGDPGAVTEYGVRFARPVVVPDDDDGVTLTVSGVVTEIRDDGLVGLDLTATVGDERVLSKARALVRVPTSR